MYDPVDYLLDYILNYPVEVRLILLNYPVTKLTLGQDGTEVSDVCAPLTRLTLSRCSNGAWLVSLIR